MHSWQEAATAFGSDFAYGTPLKVKKYVVVVINIFDIFNYVLRLNEAL